MSHPQYVCARTCYTGKYLKNLRKRFQDALARASSTAEESIANVRTVRSFSNDHKMVESYAVDINESYRIGRNLAAITGTLMIVNIVNRWWVRSVSRGQLCFLLVEHTHTQGKYS